MRVKKGREEVLAGRGRTRREIKGGKLRLRYTRGWRLEGMDVAEL